jgi:hypothetical protein
MFFDIFWTSYIGLFFLILAINVVPFMMPPTWLVLSTVYFLFPNQFAFVPLVLLGAFASTLGRVVLSYIGTLSRRLMNTERKESLNGAGKALRSTRYGGFLLTFVFALTPLPSNSYFLTLGTMKCNYFSVFFGFCVGRLISYGLTTMAASAVLKSLTAVFVGRLQAVLFVNVLGLLSIIVFVLIDWNTLLNERRLKFIRPKFRKKLQGETPQA